MANWIRVARIAECPPDTGLELVAADRIVGSTIAMASFTHWTACVRTKAGRWAKVR